MKLDITLYNRICEITGTDYEMAKSKDEESVLAYHDLDTMLEDLVWAYGCLEEHLEDFKRDVEENYELKPFDPYDEYGISKSDFY